MFVAKCRFPGQGLPRRRIRLVPDCDPSVRVELEKRVYEALCTGPDVPEIRHQR